MRGQVIITGAIGAALGVAAGAFLFRNNDVTEHGHRHDDDRWPQIEARLAALEAKIADLENAAPSRDDEPREVCSPLTISRAYWFDASDRPSWIPAGAVKNDGSGHVLVHVDGHRVGEGVSQYRDFYSKVDKMFVLRAPESKDIPAIAERGLWMQEFYLRIAPADLNAMQAEVPYVVVPLNGGSSPCRWQTRGDVFLTKTADEHLERVAE